MIMAYVVVCHFPADLLEYEAATLQLAIESFTPLVAQSLSPHPQLFQLLLSLMGVDTPCSRLVESPLLLVLHQVLEVHKHVCPLMLEANWFALLGPLFHLLTQLHMSLYLLGDGMVKVVAGHHRVTLQLRVYA